MGGLSFRHGVAFIAIAGVHAVLIYLLSQALHRPPAVVVQDERPAMIWLDVKLQDIDEGFTLEPQPAKRERPPSFQAPVIPGEPVPDAASDKLPIDWYDEARQQGKEAVAESLKFERRDCDPNDPPKSLLPKCVRPLPEYDWDNPKQKRAGFAGPLPYVRLGKCAVGLGFFGCGVGKPPPESTELYDRMKHPDRPTSSVPDVEAINKMPLGKPQKK